MADRIIAAKESYSFFQEKVEEIVRKRGYNVSEHARWYLVELLAAFMQADKLHSIGGEDFFSQPLVIRLLQAREAGLNRDSLLTLKHVGDTSLYLSGYFSDRLKAALVGVEYYKKLGAFAYVCLAGCLTESRDAIFTELSEKFPCLLEILNEISEEHHCTASGDILVVYERWLATKSERLKKWLEQKGVFLLNTAERKPSK